MRASGLQVVVATSAQASETEALLRQAGLDDLIDHAADSSDAGKSKPDPDIVQSAMRKAGVPVVVVRSGGWWNDDAFAGAAAIFDDPADALNGLQGSPLDPAMPGG